MKTSKIIVPALGLIVGASLVVPSTHAFWGAETLTPQSFAQVREYFVQNDFEGFKNHMAEFSRQRQGRRGDGQGLYRENINREVQNIDQGVVVLMTSEDEETIIRLQSRTDRPMPSREGIEKVVENLSNGIKMTITSQDAETVQHLQERHARSFEKGSRGKGMKQGRGQGQGRGRGGKF